MHANPITTASSSATLVDHFHPPPVPNMSAAATSTPAPASDQADPVTSTSAAVWTQRLSASFGAIADQITAASHALAAVEVPQDLGAEAGSASGSASASTIAALTARLDAIELRQERLVEELDTVRALARRRGGQGSDASLTVEEEPRADVQSDLARAVEELQKKVDGIAETVRLDQARLYARLRNAAMTTNKVTIVPPPMANGKTPVNFPGTKGEFEHMTKERYEHLLKSYDQPIKGDTAAKRQAVREFLGLPPDF